MNHKIGFNPLSRTTAHRRAMSRNMVTSLLRFERITTTKAKALEVRKAAEKLITRAKEDTVHNRRIAAKYIQDEIVLAKLFKDIGPRMKERNGGYTRVIKLGFRQGDAADMVILELVDYSLDDAKKADKKSEKKAAPKAKATDKKSADKAEKPAAKKTTKKAADGEAKKAPAKKSTAKKAAPKTEEAAAETAN